jgi:hypothetical protein
MAMTTKRPDAASKSKSPGARKTASAKPASGKAASTEARPAKARPAKTATAKAAAHILQAANGPRTVSHRKIKEAVDKVFRERAHARA